MFVFSNNMYQLGQIALKLYKKKTPRRSQKERNSRITTCKAGFPKLSTNDRIPIIKFPSKLWAGLFNDKIVSLTWKLTENIFFSIYKIS